MGLSNNLIMIGKSDSSLWMFDREDEEHYATFLDKSKDFVNNSVTAIDVHPTRPEFVVLGF